MFEASGTTKMTGWTTTMNNGSHWDTSNDKFVAPVAGIYHFAMNIMAGQTTGDVQYRIYKNDSLYAGSNSLAEGGSWRQTVVTAVVTMAANDWVDFHLYSSATNGGIHIAYSGTYTHIDGHLIG
jgi:hypothetical protein